MAEENTDYVFNQIAGLGTGHKAWNYIAECNHSYYVFYRWLRDNDADYYSSLPPVD